MFWFSGVTSRAPTYDQLLNKIPELVSASLVELESEPVIGNLSQLCHDYIVSFQEKFKEDISGEASEMCSVLCDNFNDIMKGRKALFPSSIRCAFYSRTNKLLSTKEFIASMTGCMTALCEGEDSVINVVFGNLIFILSKKTLVYIIRTMQGCAVTPGIERKKRSEDDIDSIEFRQLVYHIGGCIVSGFLWKGGQYSENSQTWAVFCDVLKSKFLRSEDRSDECSEDIRAHTDALDRGGLKHISDAAFDFFLMLFDFLMSLEADDGSLPADVIDSYVLQNDVLLCLWDVLVCDYLGEMDSLDLLVQMTEKAVKITIKGIMNRRLSEGLQKAYDSVGLRARLAK